MRRAAMMIGLLLGTLHLTPALAQQNRPWWVAFEIGEGEIKLTSDQQTTGSRDGTFAMGFAGGHSIGSRLRAGAHLNGWLLQAYDLNDPTVGESVSNVAAVLDAFPIARKPLFLRGGIGLAMYTNERPTGTNGHGLGWEGGGGYEFRLPGNLGFAPTVEYAAGNFGGAYDPVSPVTGRHYSVIEFKVVAIYRFGGGAKTKTATRAISGQH